MKKRSIKSLNFKKSSISSLTNSILGGIDSSNQSNTSCEVKQTCQYSCNGSCYCAQEPANPSDAN